MTTHQIFSIDHMAAFCCVCHQPTTDTHVTDRIYCAACCEYCKPPAERTGEVVGLAGEQGSMF